MLGVVGNGNGVFVPEVSFNEGIQIAIHYGSDVGCFVSSAYVFDKLVRMEDVVAYLLSPIRLYRVSPYLLYLRRPLLLRYHQQLRFQPA